jgi:inositol-phosphate phosphatase / L-galactose 1-phosphate phosphatase / histidinol-phosphatase
MGVDGDLGYAAMAAFARTLADVARPIALRHFRTPLLVETKSDSSPVTIVDREIEDQLRSRIEANFPDHGVFGEERGRYEANRRHTWVIDPIDGTKSFISGMPTFGTLVALCVDGMPKVGVIDMPALDERWTASPGEPALWNGVACRTRQCHALGEAILYTTSPDAFAPDEWALFDELSRDAMLRRFGGDCYSYGLLASGLIDAVIETGLHPYDIMAAVPVIEAAGGVVTGWAGEALGLSSDGRVVAAATRTLHDQLLTRLGR